MTERTWPARFDATLRVLVALVGTLPIAVLASVCLARWLPFAEAKRLALGFTLAIPLWVALMSFIFLARSGWRACGACLAVTLFLGLLAHGCSDGGKSSGQHHETSAAAAKRSQEGINGT